MSKPFLSVLMGSDGDLSVLPTAVDELTALHIPYEARILSAHRTPVAIADYVAQANQKLQSAITV